MSVSFKKLRDPRLGLLDKLSFGKLQGCRVVDVIPDYYEYLIWAEKSGLVRFDAAATQAILAQAGFEFCERYKREEIDPWLDSDVPY